MKTIYINAVELAKVILDHKESVGSPDFAIYADMQGAIDCRHDTEDNSEWVEMKTR